MKNRFTWITERIFQVLYVKSTCCSMETNAFSWHFTVNVEQQDNHLRRMHSGQLGHRWFSDYTMFAHAPRIGYWAVLRDIWACLQQDLVGNQADQTQCDSLNNDTKRHQTTFNSSLNFCYSARTGTVCRPPDEKIQSQTKSPFSCMGFTLFHRKFLLHQ